MEQFLGMGQNKSPGKTEWQLIIRRATLVFAYMRHHRLAWTRPLTLALCLLGGGLLDGRSQSAPSTASPSPGSPTNTVVLAAPAGDPGTNSEAIEREYKALMMADDAAQDDVERMIRENEGFAAKGAGLPEAELRRRSRERLEAVRKAYEDFLKLHPDHARAQVAFAAFLGDLGEEDTAQEHLERALTLSPKDPAIYNNLANIYGHIGPIKKSFEYFAKAVELNPSEPVYYHNFANAVFLFRKDAQEYYHVEEPQVFEKAFNLYSNATRLDPDNFPLASDVAQTYYGVRPFPVDRALESWTNALHIAHDEVEREGVEVHFARIKLLAGRFSEVQAHLDTIHDATYADLKKRLTRNLEERRQAAAGGTNAPAKLPEGVDPPTFPAGRTVTP